MEVDAQGAAVRPVAALPSYTSWRQDAYSARAGVVEALELSKVPWGNSFAAMNGGSPGTYATYLHFQRGPGFPIIGKLPDYGGVCRSDTEIGNSQPRLNEGPPSSLHASGVYNLAWSQLSSYIANPPASCSLLLRGDTLTRLPDHLANLQPFDGSRTTRSVFDMRVFKAETSVDLERFRRDWNDVPVCAEFLKTGLIALAQGMPLEGQSGVPKNVFTGGGLVVAC